MHHMVLTYKSKWQASGPSFSMRFRLASGCLGFYCMRRKNAEKRLRIAGKNAIRKFANCADYTIHHSLNMCHVHDLASFKNAEVDCHCSSVKSRRQKWSLDTALMRGMQLHRSQSVSFQLHVYSMSHPQMKNG